MATLAEVAERLGSALSVPVQGAAELAAAEAVQQRDQAYVYLLSETATGNDVLTGGVRQTLARTFGVALAVTNRRDARGESGMGGLEALRGEVRAALQGWEPSGDSAGPGVFRRGRLMRFADRTVWWQDEYELPALSSAVA